MNSEVIITCAVTGAGDTANKHPDLPITPTAIAAACVEAADAGAAVVQGRRARRPGRRRGEAPGARGARVVLGRGQGAAKASDARAREGARARREERARGEIAAGVFR